MKMNSWSVLCLARGAVWEIKRAAEKLDISVESMHNEQPVRVWKKLWRGDENKETEEEDDVVKEIKNEKRKNG